MAIPLTPPLCAVAISQSTVTNTQTETGGMSTTGVLNVVTVTDTATANTTAGGNGLTASMDFGALNVETTQTLGGNYSAPTFGNCTANICSLTHTNITGNVGAVAITTASTGNEVTSNNIGGTALTGNYTQSAGSVAITSENDFNAPNPSPNAVVTGNASVTSQAIANSISYGLSGNATSNTTSNVTTHQTSAAMIDAETGSEVGGGSGATIGDSAGTISFNTIGIANNLGATGTGVTGQTINATQTTTGNLTQAAGFVNAGNAETVQGSVVATANNLSATNEGGALNVVDTQTNSSFVHAQSVVSDFAFGTGVATADAMGNSVLAGNFGPSSSLDNTQSNTNGVFATSDFTGGNTASQSYDASSTATAMGNTATAYACSACGGVININNSQTNSGGVQAAASSTMDGSARSVNVTSTAMGNSATFYVSRPSN
jgi:hypothetical protein